MHTDLVQWTRIRHRILKEGAPRRQIAREFGMHRQTVAKIIRHRVPPGYRRSQPQRRPVIGPYATEISRLLNQNEMLPRHARLTIKDLFEKLRADCGYTGSYCALRDYIRHRKYPAVDIWSDVFNMLTSLPESDAKSLLHLLSKSDPPVISERKATELVSRCRSLFGPKPSRQRDRRKKEKEAATRWMHDVLQKSRSRADIRRDVGDVPGFDELLNQVYTGGLAKRNKALCALANASGISVRTIAEFLDISRKTVRRYVADFRSGGVTSLNARRRRASKKSDDERIRKAVFKTLHEPPAVYGINRTSWKRDDLISALASKGIKLSHGVLLEVVRKEGFKWKKARVVLTSKDPEYREKLANIQGILGALREDEAFFSIDEYGPFSIRSKGGRKLVAPGEDFTIPQWQRSRGKLIMTAALELATNQVTHFYSEKKNTDEMIKMADLLVDKYRGYSRIWLSWDAASWHISKRLGEHIEAANEKAVSSGSPVLATAALPAGAQFLNVIESVFSGLARNVIHNSDYRSADEAKHAIDEYFESRNHHYRRNPKRAGMKIWGKERVACGFDDANNCKDPRYR